MHYGSEKMQAVLMASQISFSTYLTGYRQDLRSCLKQEFGTDVMVRPPCVRSNAAFHVEPTAGQHAVVSLMSM